MKWRAEHRVCESFDFSSPQDHNAPQTLAHYYQRRLLADAPVGHFIPKLPDDARERFEETHPVGYCLTIPRLGAGRVLDRITYDAPRSRGDMALDFSAA